jgi:hypothetical protein
MVRAADSFFEKPKWKSKDFSIWLSKLGCTRITLRVGKSSLSGVPVELAKLGET